MTRLVAQARDTGRSVVRLRKEVAFARLLARLFAVAPDRWILKGALALDYRLGDRARTTKDIDLATAGDDAAATDDLLAAQALDLGDFFGFAIERTSALDRRVEGSAVRYHVRSELAGRVFDEFLLDVGFDPPRDVELDWLRGPDLLAFAEIAPVDVPALPIEFHVAEKLHAYSRVYGLGSVGSTRVKDLVDLALIAPESRSSSASSISSLRNGWPASAAPCIAISALGFGSSSNRTRKSNAVPTVPGLAPSRGSTTSGGLVCP